MVASIGDDSIVHNGTLFVHHQTELGLTNLQRSDISDHHLLDEGQSILSMPLDLAHVTDIEKSSTGGRSGVNVFLQDTKTLVLDRQGVTGKGDYLTTQTHVEIVKSSLLESLTSGGKLARRGNLCGISCDFSEHDSKISFQKVNGKN